MMRLAIFIFVSFWNLYTLFENYLDIKNMHFCQSNCMDSQKSKLKWGLLNYNFGNILSHYSCMNQKRESSSVQAMSRFKIIMFRVYHFLLTTWKSLSTATHGTGDNSQISPTARPWECFDNLSTSLWRNNRLGQIFR